jgi:predicted TIM-barrel fold metal-dependent hydrolase
MRPGFVLDIHQHLASDPSLWEAQILARLEFMQKFHIDAACLMPAAMRGGETSADQLNEQLREHQEAHADAFPAAFGAVDLKRRVDHVRAQVARVSDLGLAGVVCHHMFEGEFLDSPVTRHVVETCGENGLLPVVHIIVGSLTEAPWRLGSLCEEFPHTRILALDGLSSPHHGAWMLRLAQRHGNLYFDTAVLASYGNLIERFVAAVGESRLLFGSDYEVDPKPFSFPYPLAEIQHADIPLEARERILGGNAADLVSMPRLAARA